MSGIATVRRSGSPGVRKSCDPMIIVSDTRHGCSVMEDGAIPEDFRTSGLPDFRTVAIPSHIKPDPLRQRQVRGVVHRVGRPPHVGLPRVAAGFAAAAGELLAAEGAADLRAAGADVDVA